MTLDVLRLHADLLAVNKPAGIPVHAGQGHDDHLIARVERHLTREGLAFEGPLGPANRLDRDVSGVVLIGLTADMRAALAARFEAREVRKVYVAAVLGKTWDKGVINRPLGRGKTAPKPARTRYRRLATTGKTSFLKLTAETGLSHQIRRHLAGIQHPILGDDRYGSTRGATRWREQMGLDRIMLHARQITLEHPTTGERFHVVASPDDAWQRVITRLGLES